MYRRVALVSHSFFPAENRKNLAWLAESFDVRVITPARWTFRPERQYFKPTDLEVSDYVRELFLPVPMLRVIPERELTHFALRTLSFGFRRNPPDVIHVDTEPWSPLFWQVVVARRLFAPRAALVLTPKKNTYREHRGVWGWMKRRSARAALNHVDLLLPASEMALSLYRERFDDLPDAHVVTHMAVDVDRFSPAGPDEQRDGEPPSDRIVVGYCGLFIEHKGVEDLIDAAQLAVNRGVDLRLRLLGSGPMLEELRDLEARFDWLEMVEAVPMDRVAEFLRSLDLFVMPSRVKPDHQEHDALGLLQALATGLPTIGTKSGIIPEILRNDTGMLVDPGRADELADALSLLAQDGSLRESYGKRARRAAVDRFSIQAAGTAKADLYRQAMASRS